MSTILDRIVADKLAEVAAARQCVPETELERLARDMPPGRDFRAALERGTGVQVIAEVKKASPSAGVLRPDFDPAAIARLYEAHGAACISVLTDAKYFQGHLDHLRAVKAATSRTPVLRKDFVIDRYQLLEAKAAGADAVLLIAEVLHGEALPRLINEAKSLGLQTLVELYDRENLRRVLDAGAKLVGVNNRDLRTFEVRLEHTLALIAEMPPDCCVVSESGIRTRADLERLQAAGVRAILVGETFMRAPNPGAKLTELLSRAVAPSPPSETL